MTAKMAAAAACLDSAGHATNAVLFEMGVLRKGRERLAVGHRKGKMRPQRRLSLLLPAHAVNRIYGRHRPVGKPIDQRQHRPFIFSADDRIGP